MIGCSVRDGVRINKCSAWVIGRIIIPLTERQTDRHGERAHLGGKINSAWDIMG